MIGSTSRTAAPRGLTLVELLVVVAILVLLVGVVLPLAQPALKSRETREAARQINTFLAGAAARAVADGRGVGVRLIAAPGTSRCYRLLMYRERPPFAGFSPLSRVRWEVAGAGMTRLNFVVNGNPDAGTISFLASQLGATDGIPFFTIQFGHRGHYYRCKYEQGNVADPQDDMFLIDPAGQLIDYPIPPEPSGAGGFSYQMHLPPVPSAAGAMDLPQGAYIDLAASGFGLLGRLRLEMPVLVMFHPRSGLATYYGFADYPDPNTGDYGGPAEPVRDGDLYASTPRDDLLLLVARSKDASDENPSDPDHTLRPTRGSLWVSVAHKTGQVRTAPNLGSVAIDSNQARAEARGSALIGGHMGG